MSDLFRSEAIAHKSQRFHGAVVLTRTWTYPALTLFFAALLAALVLFSLFFGFTRKETVAGIVVPDRGMIRLTAPQAGIISRIEVVEGQQIRSGDVLFVLSSERGIANGGVEAAVKQSLTSRIAAVRGELAQQGKLTNNKQDEIAARMSTLAASARMLDEELGLRQRKVQIAREQAARLAELAETGAVTRNAAQERSAELLEQESRMNATARERVELLRQIATLKASGTDLPLQAAREASQLQRAIEELQQQISESEVRREVLVRADRPGRIAGIVANPGQSVMAEQRLASLMPAGSALEVELYAPTRAGGFVQPGTVVLLRYDAFPYQKYGQFHGRVREVSLNAIPLNELQQAGGWQAPGGNGAANEPVYRIRVRLDAQDIAGAGGRHALKPGMQLSASLVLEKRTVAEWVLAPLLGMAGRL